MCTAVPSRTPLGHDVQRPRIEYQSENNEQWYDGNEPKSIRIHPHETIVDTKITVTKIEPEDSALPIVRIAQLDAAGSNTRTESF